MKEAEMHATGKEFYIRHKAVRENAATTKIRIVYETSARAKDTAPSLNECLETGPPLQKPDLESASPRKISCSSNSRRH